MRTISAIALLPQLAHAANVAPDAPGVVYTGRFNHGKPSAPTFSWAGSTVATTFNGTSISANLSAPDDGMRLRIMIDGNTTGFVVATAGGPDNYPRNVAADPAGYTCQANMNYEGEKNCFSADCPSTGVAMIDACAKLCDDYKKDKCHVFVYNAQKECYLKSDYTTASPDDPSLGTISCTNGAPAPPAPPAGGGKWKAYVLASGLSSGQHTVTMWKATEDNSNKGSKGVAAFGGFSTDGSFAPIHAVAAPTRRLECIGDSDTAGWCADGSPKTGDNANKEQVRGVWDNYIYIAAIITGIPS